MFFLSIDVVEDDDGDDGKIWQHQFFCQMLL